VFLPSFDARSGVIGDAFAEPGVGGGLASLLSKSASLPLHTSVSLTIAALAIGLAVLGGFVAGSFGGWRTARLQPAEALRRMQ
jgi:ABC-type antimicrobial peptide transport system permease subunit